MPRHRYMLIRILNNGVKTELELDGPCSIESIIQKMGILPSTVLAIHNDSVIPYNAIVNEDIELELIIVSSGG